MKRTILVFMMLLAMCASAISADLWTTVSEGPIASAYPQIPLAMLYLFTSTTDAGGAPDRCASYAKQVVSISQAETGPLTIIAGVSGRKVYICSIILVSASAQNINLVESAGTNCSSVTNGLLGGYTAGTGLNLAANAQIILGNGTATVAASRTAGDNVCLVSSSTGQISGAITYVQR